MKPSEHYKAIQLELANADLYHGDLDGIPGKQTDSGYNQLRQLAVEEFRENQIELAAATPVSITPAANGEISQSAINLILDAEGIDQPYLWPGGGSGITLGYGCDIGADPQSLQYWSGKFTPEQFDRLKEAKGVVGDRAQNIASNYKDIKVSKSDALDVFYRFTLPIETAKTKAAFPGADQLPPPALGALVSLVFNRGTSRKATNGSRVEMQDIYDVLADGVQSGDLQKLAADFRAMKRLWANKGLDGLIARREEEARLIESCIA